MAASRSSEGGGSGGRAPIGLDGVCEALRRCHRSERTMRSQPSRGEETVEAHLRPEVVEVALWWSSI